MDFLDEKEIDYEEPIQQYELEVKQDNNFIRLSNQYKLSITEKRLLCYIVAKEYEEIKKKKITDYKNITPVLFSFEEYKKYIYKNDIKETNNTTYYNRIEKDLEALQQKVIWVHLPEDKKTTRTLLSIFNKVKLDNYDELIWLSIEEHLLQDYIKILENSQFTKYFLDNIVKINNKYGQRLYEILKSLEGMAINGKLKKEINIEELKKALLNIDKKGKILDKSYERLCDFNKRVLQKAKESINENTDIYFDFKPNKKRNATKIIFDIDYTNSDRKNKIEKSDIQQEEEEYKQTYNEFMTNIEKAEEETKEDSINDRQQFLFYLNKMFGEPTKRHIILFDKLKREYNFDYEVLEKLVDYCKDNNKTTINYIQKVADDWADAGIKTEIDAKRYLSNIEKWHDKKIKQQEEKIENENKTFLNKKRKKKNRKANFTERNESLQNTEYNNAKNGLFS